MRKEMDLWSAGCLREGRNYIGELALAGGEEPLDDLGLEPNAAPTRRDDKDARELRELRRLKID